MHVQIFTQQNVLGVMDILWKWSKILEVAFIIYLLISFKKN